MSRIVTSRSLTNESINPLSPKTRRATIIVNIINIVFAVMSLSAGLAYISSASSNFDDDEVKQSMNSATQYGWISMVFAGLTILVSSLGIWGAKNYIGWMVMVAAVWYCTIGVGFSLFTLNFGGAICAALFAYPHFALFLAMQKGIMTEENYPNEMHSCCCV
jgi:hypothetical protein